MASFLLPPAPLDTLDAYLATETGGLGLRRAIELGPADTIAEIEQSGLRGRGGAGFPTGRKWASVAAQPGTHRYVVVNAAEGEPGTFKDRALLRANPYQLVEGVFIAGFAVGAVEAFVCLKASFAEEVERVTAAIAEMQRAGICSDCQITVVQGPDDYLYGEEKAMLEVIEGRSPLPRLLPPYEHGLFATAPQLGWEATEARHGHTGRHESNPTLVNNAETLSNTPHILAHGAGWFRRSGTAASPGRVVATVVGDVVHAGVGEVALGTPLAEVIETVGGGARPGRTIKAVLSGVSNPVIIGTQLAVALSYEGFASIGTGLGAAGFIVYDDSACMVAVAEHVSRFLATESCGQCPPCKRGSIEITERLERIESGAGHLDDLDDIGAWLAKVTDGNRCYLAVQERNVVASILRSFPEEFAEHLEQKACPRPRPMRLPKLADLRDGVATYAYPLLSHTGSPLRSR